MNKNLMIVIASVAATGVIGFYGGMKYQQTKAPSFAFGQFQQARGAGRGVGGPGGMAGSVTFTRPVVGEITNVDDSSMTVKMQDGSSKIVILSGSTVYNKMADTTAAELKPGVRVAVTGKSNSDGSETAQTVQINPSMRMFGGPTPTGTK